MKIKLKNYARQLWLSLLLLVGVAAIAVPGLNGTNSDNVAEINGTGYETLEAAVDAAKSGETIVLLADIDLSNHERSKCDDIILTGVTLDMNGKTIRGFNSGVRYSGTGAVIKNGTFDFVEAEAKPNYGLSIGSYNSKTHDTDFTLQDLTVKGGINIDYADVTLDNVNIDMGASAFYAIWVDEDGASATYNSGAITAGSSATAVFGVAKGLNGAADGSISVTGGKILTNGKNLRLGGNYLPVEVSGGVFDAAVPEDCCAEGYIPTANTDEETKATYPYTVKQGAFVAQIEGGAKYETLQSAIDAAEEGATIDILKDFTLTTVTTSPSEKYNVNIDKSVTINGNNHVITGSEGKRSIILMGDGKNITFKDLTLKNNNSESCLWIGDAVNATLDNVTLDGTKGKAYNQPLTIGQFDSENRVSLNITNGSVIKTNDAGTAHYSIIAWHPADITVTGSKLIGWANVYLKPDAAGSTVKIDGSEMKSQGLSGSSNNFAIIVTEGNGNTIEVKDTKIEGAAVEGTNQSLFRLGGKDNVLKFLGSTTYETNDMTWGCVTYEPGSAEINKIYFDETTKTAFAKYFAEEGGARISETADETGLYPLNYVSEVYYYWVADGVEDGGNYDLAQPFVNGWLDDGEFIRLKKDVTLASNLTWAKENASFTMTFGDFKVTKGEYSIALKQGVTVNTDKQTDIFSAVDADNKVVETAVDGGYTYTVVAKEYVAQIGEGESAVKYESLAEAVEAAGTEATTIKMLANASSDQITIPADKNIVIDFAGYTVTPTGKWLIINNGALTLSNTAEGVGGITSTFSGIVDNYGTLTVNGGTYSTTAEDATAIWNNDENSQITVNGGTVSSSKWGIVVVSKSKLTVKGDAVITGDDSAISGNGSEGQGGTTINIEGGTITGGSVGIYHPQSGNLNITGGTISGETGVYVKSGELSVTGGAINGTGAKADYNFNGNGANPTGDALVIDNCGYPGGAPTASVTGGTFTSSNATAVGSYATTGNTTIGNFVSGGYFNTELPDDICAIGKKTVASTEKEGYYEIADKDYVAQIGEGEDAVKYESLAEAVEAAGTEATTIKMLANASSDQITIPADKNIVIDFAGCTVTPTGTWLITNNGALTLKNTAEGAGGITSTYKGLVDNFGTLAVNSGTYSTTAEIAFWNNNENSTITVNSGSVSSSAIVIVAENNSIVNVAGGTITATGEKSYGIHSTSSKVNVSGGKVTAATEAIHLQESSTATISGDAIVEVTGEETWGVVILSNSTLTVKDNATITSNGFAISGNGSEGQGGTTVNIEGGTVTGGSVGIYQPQSGNLNITGGTISGETGVYVKSGELSVTGGAINGTGAKADYNFNGNGANPTGDALVIDNCGYPGGAPTASVTGGTFTSSNATAVGSYATTGNTTIGNFVSGGYFNTELPDDICAIGKKTVASTEKEGYYEIADKDYVAQIGEGENAVKYETLEEAWNAVNDGETITLLANCEGNGLIAPQGKFTNGLTVDFAGFTYTVDGSTVGSTGTETNAFQLLKDNKITFKGGTITSEKAKILVQNYSDLTLEDMTLTLNNENYTSAYTLSNNNGNIVINGTTINANPAGGFAFDVCRYSSYPSVSVTVKGDSKINGDVEVSASGNDAKDGFNLMFESATLNGEIVLDASAKTAMANTPDKAEVSKNNELTDIVAPDGYDWKDNGDKTSSLALTEEMEMVLIHGEPYPVTKTATYKKVTYKRTFEETRLGKYQCWYVPFDYTITGDENATFYKIHLISASAEQSGEVTDVTKVYIHIEKMSAGDKLSANRPYVIVANQTDYQFVLEPENGVTLYKPDNTSRLNVSTTEFNYDFYGTYKDTEAEVRHDWMSLTPKGEISWNGSIGSTLKSYVWYLRVTKRNENADYSKINFSFVDDSDYATHINSIEENMDEIEGIYSANGIKKETLSKGLNIIKYKNGKTKKIFKK